MLCPKPAHSLQNESSNKYVFLIQTLAELEGKAHPLQSTAVTMLAAVVLPEQFHEKPSPIDCLLFPPHTTINIHPRGTSPLPRSVILLQHHQNRCCSTQNPHNLHHETLWIFLSLFGAAASRKMQLKLLRCARAGEGRFPYSEGTVADERDTHSLGRKPTY